ncbi:tyrosine-type recombinase/integrase [Streptomyces sp. NRRL F-5135]|uniref:tyrosine-type recombinase/integrase n=1 Tax=Streptomyces sp. NRRL F-5135 TaxID=1463858 RepID=UPI000B0F9EDA|nr:tyrosine-type recombinase/integrase [Streptomyces sp. NRRL F-5135]
MIVDERYTIHTEGSVYLAGLRAADRSPNTERVYASRVALYQTYCRTVGLDWCRPTFLELARFAQWLITEPLPPRGPRSTVVRFRTKKSANAVLTTVFEFLRFGTAHGWVPAEVVDRLSAQKYLSFLPPGYDAGEDAQYRTVNGRTIKFVVADDGIEWLADAQIEGLLELTPRARDRFLVALLRCTGIRIGEGLGLRREDMHFLTRSEIFGCQVTGPHVHVRRRLNPNGALAKSAYSRWIPVAEQVVGLYAEQPGGRGLGPHLASTAHRHPAGLRDRPVRARAVGTEDAVLVPRRQAPARRIGRARRGVGSAADAVPACPPVLADPIPAGDALGDALCPSAARCPRRKDRPDSGPDARRPVG